MSDLTFKDVQNVLEAEYSNHSLFPFLLKYFKQYFENGKNSKYLADTYKKLAKE